jgi:hypothetical protein
LRQGGLRDHGDEGIELGLRRLDAGEQALRELRHGKFFGAELRRELGSVKVCILL